ncbi:MAG: TonB-dependent receptor [Saprospiraceae bacterium]|nr:TonB-dependent receptor [Saprospiraceae bacterium]MDW8228580.1 TonB-dependent receptor [Saprospiraceae bacterium]
MKQFYLLMLFWGVLAPFSLRAQALRGQVRDAISGYPVGGATIRLSDGRSNNGPSAISDSTGAFALTSLLPGLYLCSIEAQGYETLLLPEVRLVSGRAVTLDLTLKPSARPLPDVVIRASAERQTLLPLGEIPLTREKTQRFPATFFDPARLAMAFAGVANADDQANGLVVRGNGPQNVRWRLEGVEIVNPNHLPNAGTLSDRPTTAAGGVLLFSAQLLDNSTLLTGALPPGYGDAFGGIMDMYWRKGNAQRHELTAQASLLGLDFSAEGPLDRRRGHSYLFNYRYSTVGLLGQMGISFGNEQIWFQDYSFKTAFSGKNGGEWAIFGAVGDSRNRFTPPGDSADARQFKDLFQIDFRSSTGLLGTSGNTALGARTRLFVSAVGSAQRNTRTAEARNLFSERDTSLEARAGLSLRLSHQSHSRRRWQAGLLAQYASFDTGAERRDSLLYSSNAQTLTLQPWVSFYWTAPSERTQVQVGLHNLLWHSGQHTSSRRLEPRLTVVQRLNERHQLAFFAGLNSQTHPLWFYALHPNNAAEANRLIGVSIAHALQLSARHSWTLNDWWRLRAEVFHQRQRGIPAVGPVHLSNISEQQPLGVLVAEGQAQNTGAELSAERFLSNGWFLLANTTLLQARYTGADKVQRLSRWNTGYMANFIAGKEWTLDDWPERLRTFGVNGRLVWVGGQRAAPLDTTASAAKQATVYDLANGYPIRLPDFIRLDLRIYWRRHIGQRRNSLLAFDLQNATIRNNIAYYYYDPLLRQVATKNQLGFVPNISWRLEW